MSVATQLNDQATASSQTTSSQTMWLDVCAHDDLVLNSGVCALVNGKAIALFTHKIGNAINVYAISNYDPVGKASVLSRGLIGGKGDIIFVASPLYKQRYCLASGKCIDDDTLSVPAYAAKIENDRVFVAMS